MNCARLPVSLFLTGMLLVSVQAEAEDITYDGSNPSLLDIVNGQPDSLAPTPDSSVTPPDKKSGSLVGNEILVRSTTPTTIAGDVYGAVNLIAGDTDAISNNRVIIDDNGTIGGNVYGGYSTSATVGIFNAAGGNKVTINGTVQNDVYGGYSDSGDVTGNSVSITTYGTVNGKVYGGYSTSGSVTGNSLILNKALTDVYGGGSDSGPVKSNKITIGEANSAPTITNAYGGWSNTGDVGGSDAKEGNQVLVKSGRITNAYGGYAQDFTSNTGTVMYNSVVIDRGTVTNAYGGYSISTTDPASAYSNNARNNSVTLNEGFVSNDVYGAQVEVDSTHIHDVTATNNQVIINGGQVTGDVYGAHASSTGTAGHVTATGNSITISGQVNGNVYGAYAESVNSSTTATGNIVTIKEGASFGPNSVLYGANFASTGTAKPNLFSGNTLNIHTPITVQGLYNFATLNFYLPPTLTANQVPRISIVGGSANLTDGQKPANPFPSPTDQGDNSSTVHIGITGMSSLLKKGDTIILIKTDARGALLTNGLNRNATGMQGLSLQYEFALTVNSDLDTLSATVTKADLNPQIRAFSEAQMASFALSQSSADIVAEQGMTAARAPRVSGWGPFGAVNGKSLSYYTTRSYVDAIEPDSRVDMKGQSLITGFAGGIGNLTLGVFFEYAKASYKTHNDFAGVTIKGDGDARNLGGGLLGHINMTGNANGHAYFEASARAGKSRNNYRNPHLLDPYGKAADYTSSTPYYGAHFGLGYLLIPNKKSEWDFHAKYLWTQQKGKPLTLSTGDSIQFETANSHRTRLGVRGYREIAENASPYLGLAWEHEFDSKLKASASGFSIPAPSIRGDTGIAELGVSLTPYSKKAPLFVDLGIQGYVGKRQGVTWSLDLRWGF